MGALHRGGTGRGAPLSGGLSWGSSYVDPSRCGVDVLHAEPGLLYAGFCVLYAPPTA